MRRVVSVYLPRWPTDRWRRQHRAPPRDSPLVTAATQGQRRVLIAVDAVAARLGLHAGMPVAQAQSMIVDLAVVEAAPEDDLAGLTRLVAWCLSYAPLIAADPPYGIWIEIAGASHLRGGEQALLDDLTRRIRGGGFSVKAAVADTPGAAWAIARYDADRTKVVVPGGHANAIAGLPIRALRLPPEVIDGLLALGIERVGQLAGKPRAPLRLRFGEPVIQRLDQALGHAPEPIAYLPPPRTHAVRKAFPEPISAPETIARVVSDLTKALSAELERMALGARRLDLVCLRVDGEPQAIRIGTARPSRDPSHLTRLFSERLALIDPGFGIETAILAATHVETLSAYQLARYADLTESADPTAMAELVDRLTMRVGPRRVFRAAPVESEWPERSVKRVAPLAATSGASWPENLPRPARLVDPPEPVSVIAALPDHPPAAFTWQKKRRRVTQADGPERVYGEWWASAAETSALRDYYRVEDETGARYWLFRDAPASEGGRWWLHGMGEA